MVIANQNLSHQHLSCLMLWLQTIWELFSFLSLCWCSFTVQEHSWQESVSDSKNALNSTHKAPSSADKIYDQFRRLDLKSFTLTWLAYYYNNHGNDCIDQAVCWTPPASQPKPPTSTSSTSSSLSSLFPVTIIIIIIIIVICHHHHQHHYHDHYHCLKTLQRKS